MPGGHTFERLRQFNAQRLEGTTFYHYTSDAGFLGMLSYKKLWFSDHRFLNDTQEYHHGLSILRKVMAEYTTAFRGLDIETEIEDEITTYMKDKGVALYTLSLSSKADLLSQWRGYCPDGGYCLGLDAQQINDFIVRENLRVGPCFYKEAEQLDFIRDAVAYSVADIEHAFNTPGHSITRIRGEVVQALKFAIQRIPFLKHPDFEEEAEWRIVKRVDLTNLAGVASGLPEFRVGRNSLIPYYELPLLADPTAAQASPETAEQPIEPEPNLKLNSVIVSPRPHQELAVTAAKLLVSKYESCTPDAVRASKTPYRK